MGQSPDDGAGEEVCGDGRVARREAGFLGEVGFVFAEEGCPGAHDRQRGGPQPGWRLVWAALRCIPA